MTPIRVLLVDDHTLVRQGLAALLHAWPSIEVAGQASNGIEAIELTDSLHPDVVLMDLQMPVLNGVEATRRILQKHPRTKVIVLTTFSNDEYIFDAIRAGAQGYELKDVAPEQLLEDICRAHAGESLLNPVVAARVMDRLRHPDLLAAPPGEGLTERERQVLSLMAKGFRNKEIARKLFISEKTVKIHVANVLNKLSASNRTEAVVIAMQRGIVSQDAGRPGA